MKNSIKNIFTILFLILVLFSCQTKTDTKEQILSRIKVPEFSTQRFNVKDYGAKTDSAFNNKPAFDKAILACKNAGGGTVVIPAGEYFIEGPIHLENNLNLRLEEGAVLKFSSNPDHYPLVLSSWEGTLLHNYSPFIYAYQKTNIAITGKGIIDGESSNTFSKWHPLQKKDQLLSREMNHTNVPPKDRIFGKGHYLRPQLIQFFECKNILVEDVLIEDSPFWCLHILKCSNATLRGIRYNAQNKNNDGIDVEYSSDVLIENVHFNNSDDNVAIKAGRDFEGRATKMPSQNIIVRNCHFKGLHALVIGSEMSAGVHNVFVDDCDFAGFVKRGIYLKSNPDRGGEISNIFVENVQFGDVLDCFMVTSNYHNEGEGHPTTIKNIHLKNVSCKKALNYGIYIKGHALKEVSDFTIENFTVEEASRGVFVDLAKNIRLNNVKVDGKTITWKPELLKQNPNNAYDY